MAKVGRVFRKQTLPLSYGHTKALHGKRVYLLGDIGDDPSNRQPICGKRSPSTAPTAQGPAVEWHLPGDIDEAVETIEPLRERASERLILAGGDGTFHLASQILGDGKTPDQVGRLDCDGYR